MQIKTFNSFHQNHARLYAQIWLLTRTVNGTYPNYTKWFKEKFISGLKKGERMYIVAKEGKILAGCVLIKKTAEEKKICLLFVHPKFRQQGLGTQLMKRTLEELGSHPLLTVSEHNLPQVSQLLKKNGFHLSATKKGVYHPENTEYYFNDPKTDVVRNSLLPVLIQRMNQLRQR